MVGRDGAMKMMRMRLLVVALAFLAYGGKRAAAEVRHHVVGDDRGWELSTDLESWISGRVFNIGDFLWFAYSSTQGSVMEVQTMEEYLSCDLTNPIKMYTKGLDKISLDTQGTRYFTSGNLESCKNGLKLPVNVQPPPKNETMLATTVLADGPTTPSSANFIGLSFTFFVGLVISFMGV